MWEGNVQPSPPHYTPRCAAPSLGAWCTVPQPRDVPRAGVTEGSHFWSPSALHLPQSHRSPGHGAHPPADPPLLSAPTRVWGWGSRSCATPPAAPRPSSHAAVRRRGRALASAQPPEPLSTGLLTASAPAISCPGPAQLRSRCHTALPCTSLFTRPHVWHEPSLCPAPCPPAHHPGAGRFPSRAAKGSAGRAGAAGGSAPGWARDGDGAGERPERLRGATADPAARRCAEQT